jgi:ketosteroid isomerase-like protein
MMRWLLMLSLLLFTLVVTASRPAAQSAEDETVLKARGTALLERNVEAVLQQFADDALVVSSSGRLLKGRDQIRIWD